MFIGQVWQTRVFLTETLQIIRLLPVNVDFDEGLSSVCSSVSVSVRHDKIVEKSSDKDSPLDTEGREQKVKSHRGPAVTFKESHQKSESNNDHNVSVLEP